MNLHQYLIAIKQKKSINLSQFLALLPEKISPIWRTVFTQEKLAAKNSYQLKIIDDDAFTQLLNTSKPSKNRVEAAKKGDSHQHKTSMSFLLVYTHILLKKTSDKPLTALIDPPKVVVCSQLGVSLGFKQQKTLVIIENQENFFRYQEFLPRLMSYERSNSFSTDKTIDIAFGAGNSVTDSLNAPYFSQYNEILCCFDYDLGGLIMYGSLQKLIGTQQETGRSTNSNAKSSKESYTEVRFILPSKAHLNDADFIKQHFKLTPKDEKHWQKAIDLSLKYKLPELAHAFSLSKKFMEQEVFIPQND